MIKENLFVLKQTSSLGDLLIQPVAKELARQKVIEHHYSHKWNFGGFGAVSYTHLPRQKMTGQKGCQ